MTSKTTIVRSRTDESVHRGNSAIARLVSELPGEYFLISEASQITGIPVPTLRRWYRTGKTKAPSEEVTHGDQKAYLYTPADIEELRATRHTDINVSRRNQA